MGPRADSSAQSLKPFYAVGLSPSPRAEMLFTTLLIVECNSRPRESFFSLRERQVDPLFVNGPRFEFLDRIPEEMRCEDLPDRRDLEVGAGLRLCPIQSREADLTASRVAHNHENDTNKNQKIRKSSHLFVEMGRQVPPEVIFLLLWPG